MPRQPPSAQAARPERRSDPIQFAAGLSLILAGMVNLVAGLLGLLAGLFESAGASRSNAEGSVELAALLATPYGRYAVAHLIGAGLQLAGGGAVGVLAGMSNPAVHALALLAFVSLGLESWGLVLKGSLTGLSVPGFMAALCCSITYVRALRGQPPI